MDKEKLKFLKEQAKGIGKWAEYAVLEMQHWAPKDMERQNWDSLYQIEQNCLAWLDVYGGLYPPSGAEEVLRASLTEEIKSSPNCLTEEQAEEADMKIWNDDL